MADQHMPGTCRLLRLLSLLPAISILMLGMTVPWRELALPDGFIILLVVLAMLPALAALVPPLAKRLGPLHVPVVLGIYLVSQVSLSSLLHSLGLVRFDQIQFGALFVIEPGVLLMLPALLIAWEYGWRGALSAALLTGILHLSVGLASHQLPPKTIHLAPVIPILRPDLLFILPLLVAYLGILYRRQQVQQRLAQAQLRQYAAAAEALAATRERNRLAGWMQDTMARSLAGLSEQLETLGISLTTTPDRAAEQLSNAQAQADQNVRRTQEAIAHLQAPPLDELGLRGALSARAQSLAQRRGIQVDFESCGPLDCLTPEQELVIYFIAHEALEQAEDQADVRQVGLRIHCAQDFVTLTVHDDGKAVQGAAHSNGRSLEEIASSAQLLGGHFCIDRREGAGTTVALWLPCGLAGDQR